MKNITEYTDTFFHKIEYLITKNDISTNMATKYICLKLKNILRYQYREYWGKKLFENPIKNGNKLRSYRSYKNTFKEEEYLKLNSRKIKGSFARLRLSAHALQIEVGRYAKGDNRKDPDDRLCLC